jgi:hypothetical protein
MQMTLALASILHFDFVCEPGLTGAFARAAAD